MNNDLKQLFSTKKSEDDRNTNSDKEVDLVSDQSQLQAKDEKELANSFRLKGFQEAGQSRVKLSSLESHLDSLYQDHVEEIRRRKGGQEKAKEPYLNQIEREKEQKEELESEKDKVSKSLERKEGKINDLKDEIRQIREKPDDILPSVVDSNARTSFLIGAIIIVFLTFYLILFYSSASFSAFFREFETGVEVTQTIFDPKAFVKAYEEILSGLFITTIPIVFLALGYLIHKFNENQSDYWRYVKSGTLIVVTFLFDALLAYEIEKKLYEATKTINDPPFNAKIASISPEFWIIIFAGFVVYIVWGLIFGFTMNEYANIDAIKRAIRKRQDEITDLNKQIEEENKLRDDLESRINKSSSKIDRLKKIVENNVFISPKEYKLMHTHYMKGWITFMSGNECSEEEIQEANDISEKKLKTLLGPLNKDESYEAS